MAKMTSPYAGVAQDGWAKVTQGLLEAHPLQGDEIVEVVLATDQNCGLRPEFGSREKIFGAG